MTTKRHHYVPRFLLARFAEAGSGDNPLIWKLSKETGRSQRTGVNNETVVSHYYRVDTVIEGLQRSPEEALSMIEDKAAGVIGNLVGKMGIGLQERGELAMFLAAQHARTPMGREWNAFAYEQASQMWAMKSLLDPDHVRKVVKGQYGLETDEQVEEWRNQTIGELDRGDLQLRATRDREVMLVFQSVQIAAPVIADRMSWTGLFASGRKGFILADHPLTIVDESAAPGVGVGWLSSADTQVTIPLDPHFALLLRPGNGGYTWHEVGDDVVRDVNLRSYASANWDIFGSSANSVQAVRSDAKAFKSRVHRYAPRPPRFVTFETEEGSDEIKRTVEVRGASRATRGRRKS